MLSPAKHEVTDRALFRRTFAVLSVVVGLGPLAVDSTMPAVRDMADGLGTDMGTVQATLGAYVAGTAAGQLIFGALADRYGRRPTLIFGLTAYVAAALLLVFAQSIGPVFALRFVLGLGTAAAFVVTRAVVRDLFNVATSARMYASLFQVLGFFPMLCPIIAGELTELFGWRSVYAAIAVFSGVGLIVIELGLRESLVVVDRHALHVRKIAASFAEVLRDPTFLAYLIVGIGAYIGLMTVLAAMPPIIIGHLGGSPTVVGYVYAIVMFAHFAGAAIGNRLIRRLGLASMIAIGVAMIGLAALTSIVVAVGGWVSIVTVVAANAMLTAGFALTNPAMTAGALSNFHHMAGRATAALGFIQQTTGAATVFLIGLATDGSPRPHAFAMACAGVIAVGAYLALVRPLKPKAA